MSVLIEARIWTLLRSDDYDYKYIYGQIVFNKGIFTVKVTNSGSGKYTISSRKEIKGTIKFGKNNATAMYHEYPHIEQRKEASIAEKSIIYMKGKFHYELKIYNDELYLLLDEKGKKKRRLIFYCSGILNE